jgi:O-antigen ligase
LVLGVFVWGYSLYQTNGLIKNRYENKDARGRLKEDRLGGREKLVITELNMFLDNPLLGVGIGKNKEYREEMTGIVAASHNEISRMLAEQGLFGILGLLILLLIPMLHFLENREHIFLFSFFLFWLFTINHAAMRIAAPAFIYALSLLKVTFDEEPTLHRE